MISNMKSNLSDKFDAIIKGRYFKNIEKKFEYCMGHPEITMQVI